MQTEATIERSGITAEQINNAHRQVISARNELFKGGRALLDAATECGNMLIAKKQEVGHGNWLPWLDDNFDAHWSTARDYMRLAANRVNSLHLDGVTSINEALKLLADKQEPSTKTAQGKDFIAIIESFCKRTKDVIGWPAQEKRQWVTDMKAHVAMVEATL